MAKIVINANTEQSTTHTVVLFDNNDEIVYEDVSTRNCIKEKGENYITGHVLVSLDNLLTILKG